MAVSASALSSQTVAWNANPEPDIGGYVVYLGTTSGVYPTIQDVGNATSHVLSGLSDSTTYFCAVQAYNTSGQMSALSGVIEFTPGSIGGSGAFNTWATTGGLSGAAAVPSATPFHDGVSNLAKFAFNMNAAGPDTRTLVKGTGTAGLPVFSLESGGSQPAFTVEFLRRKNSGLVYTPKSSANLGTFVPMTGTTTVTSVDTTWERVIIRKTINTATTPTLFGIVEVTMP